MCYDPLMFILCFLDLSLSVFALFVCVVWWGFGSSAMLCLLDLSFVSWWWGLGPLLSCGSVSFLVCCLVSFVFCLVSLVLCCLVGLGPSPLRSWVFLICLLFAGGASALLCDPVLFISLLFVGGRWPLVRSCAFLFVSFCVLLSPYACVALCCGFGAQPLFFDLAFS